MKRIIFGCLSLMLAGCAHKITSDHQVNLPFAADLVQGIQQDAGRAPASFEWEMSDTKSSRRVYFTALYHQYLTLGRFLEVGSTITFCPQFHHDKIETDGFATPVISETKIPKIAPEGKAYFPELAFNKKFSLKDHHTSIREELDVMCEEGLSDNFYKFDNLVTHYANKKSFHLKPEAMASVLKIPVFANYYLVKMLQSHQIGFTFTHPEEKRVIVMTNTQWFEKYVTEASRVRNTLLKTQMVKR
jgi:hypothetical protein